jgi:hypothetical protein
MSVIPVLGRLKQKNSKFEASQGYIVRLCLERKNERKERKKRCHH